MKPICAVVAPRSRARYDTMGRIRSMDVVRSRTQLTVRMNQLAVTRAAPDEGLWSYRPTVPDVHVGHRPAHRRSMPASTERNRSARGSTAVELGLRRSRRQLG